MLRHASWAKDIRVQILSKAYYSYSILLLIAEINPFNHWITIIFVYLESDIVCYVIGHS